jgi:hypothetical protein
MEPKPNSPSKYKIQLPDLGVLRFNETIKKIKYKVYNQLNKIIYEN